ncbi:MAG TPA: AraC family transcriptional regulator [Hanamia sp.]|nr:AraC family transcriptional regulator [Hanamia sp.]
METNLRGIRRDFFEEYLLPIADLFGTEVEDKTVNIPASSGSGFIKYIELEKGLGIQYYDFILKADLEFNIFYHHTTELTYRILYVLRDDSVSCPPSKDFITMYNSKVKMKESVKRGKHFCRMVILFNAVWLENNYGEASARIRQLTESFIVNNKSPEISQEFDHKGHILSSELATGLTKNSLPHITVKMICIILLNEFLNKIMVKDNAKILSDGSSHYETILRVEKRLTASLTTSLPCVQELAAEVNLSTSTLQRHFKLVFGKTIYEYYQEKRMILGKYEIENGFKTISQVAYQLGFNKVNNFSKAFRKQFHFLPRDLKFKKIA